MKVQIKPIDKHKWHGKSGKESFTRVKKIQALVNPSTNEYCTGLSEKDIDYLKNKKGVVYNLSPTFNSQEPHEFWDSSVSVVKLANTTSFFDDNNPLDYIKIRIMKASKFVANSLQDYKEGKYPDATHVIFNEQEEVEAKVVKVQRKNKAILECSKLPKNRKLQLILLIGGRNLKGKSDAFIEVELDKITENKYDEVLRQLNKDKEVISLEALVEESLQKNVLRKKGHKIYYQESVIGQDKDEVVNYLLDPKNQDLKLRIMSLIE